MASLIKQRGWYYAQFFDAARQPSRKQVPLRTRTKQVAARLARRLEDEYALGRLDPWKIDTAPTEPQPPSTLGLAASAFLAEKAHLRATTQRHYRLYLGWLEADLGSQRPLSSITTADLKRFLYRSEIKDVTRASYFRHLRVFFRWVLARGAITRDITKEVKLPRVPDRFPRFLTPEDLARLVGTIRSSRQAWLADVVAATALLGLRLGEVCALRWGHLDLERGRLVVRNADGFVAKSGTERAIPVPAGALAVFRRLHARHGGRAALDAFVFTYAMGAKMNSTYVSHTFCRLRRSAGLPEGVSFHTLRHTAASWLMMRGASIEAVRLYLGHSSVTVTEKYAHLSERSFHHEVRTALDGVTQPLAL